MQALIMSNKISGDSAERRCQAGISKKEEGLERGTYTCRGVNITKRLVYIDL